MDERKDEDGKERVERLTSVASVAKAVTDSDRRGFRLDGEKWRRVCRLSTSTHPYPYPYTATIYSTRA